MSFSDSEPTSLSRILQLSSDMSFCLAIARTFEDFIASLKLRILKVTSLITAKILLQVKHLFWMFQGKGAFMQLHDPYTHPHIALMSMPLKTRHKCGSRKWGMEAEKLSKRLIWNSPTQSCGYKIRVQLPACCCCTGLWLHFMGRRGEEEAVLREIAVLLALDMGHRFAIFIKNLCRPNGMCCFKLLLL